MVVTDLFPESDMLRTPLFLLMWWKLGKPFLPIPDTLRLEQPSPWNPRPLPIQIPTSVPSLIHTPAGGVVYLSNNSRVRGTEPQLLCLPCWEPVTCWEHTASFRAVNHRQWVHPRGGLALARWGSDSVPASHILHSQLSSDKGDIWSPMWFTPLSRFLTDAELK